MVSRMGNSITYGHDEIDAITLKLVLPLILIPLTHIINTSLSTNQYAMKWKLAKVSPLIKDKTSNHLDPSEYRPISLLSSVSKIVERAAQLQLLKHFEDAELLNNSGHAYRTDMDIAQICQHLYEATERRNIAALMTVDQSSAFDSLSHDILVDKLRLYGLSQDALDWVRNYLVGRAHYVKVGAAASRWRSLHHGVPQGSVLGPLLYAIYVNDMTEAVRRTDCQDSAHDNKDNLFGQLCPKCGNLTMFADDATYQVDNKKRQDNQDKLNENLEKINEYMNNNELKMNLKKTTLSRVYAEPKKREGHQDLHPNSQCTYLLLRPRTSWTSGAVESWVQHCKQICPGHCTWTKTKKHSFLL